MSERQAKKQAALIIVGLLICMMAIAAYRFILINDYISKYIDEDQALMWYGTVLGSHGGIREPHFMGQPYGSMAESIAAIPLYKAGIPLEWALPLATLAIWLFPFVYCAWICRREMPAVSILIMLSALIYHWDYDILTNIPRSFISGFPFAFLSLGLLTSRRHPTPWKLFFGVLLAGIAYEATSTSIAVFAFGFLYLLLYHFSWLKRDWWAFLIGAVISVLFISYCNNGFYEAKPEYWVYSTADTLSISLTTLANNIKRLPTILRSFSIINFKGLPVAFFLYLSVAAVWIGSIMKRRDYRFLLVVICAVIGCTLFMAIPKTDNFSSDLYYPIARLYLYFPYVVVAVLMLFSRQYQKMEEDTSKRRFFEKWHTMYKFAVPALVLATVLTSGFKIYQFKTSVIFYPQLYQHTYLRQFSVEEVYELADALKSFSQKNDTDILVSMNEVNKRPIVKGFDYATSAINYGEYILYRPYFERRTDVYLELRNKKLHGEKVAFFNLEENRMVDVDIVTLDNTDCITYVENLTGIVRGENKSGNPIK